MRNLLLKRPQALARYVLACFFPVATELLAVWGFARLIGSIQVGRMDYFWQSLWLTIGLGLLGIGLFISSRFMRIGFMRDTILDVRLSAFDKILSHSYDTFNRQSKEVYLSHLINDVNTFERDFFLTLLNVIFAAGRYVFAIVIILTMDVWFALGTVAASLLLYLVSARFEKRTVRIKEELSTNSERFTVELANTFNGLEILKLNRVEGKFLRKTLASIDRIERKKLDFAVFTEGQRSLTGFLSNLVFVAMLVYLLTRGFDGLSLTLLTLQLQLAASCVMPVGAVMPMFNELKASLAIYRKITASQPEAAGAVRRIQPYHFSQRIEAQGLSFAYADQAILRDVNLRLEKGRKYLVRGASGSGKSTLLKLLSMVQAGYSGALTLDGVPYSQVDEAGFNANIAFIYQDVFLFEDTIRNNITLFKPASDSHLQAVAEKAGLADLVASRGQGLEEPLLENGKNLSGGQRQRISIARAIFKQAELLFVDEGTASLNEELGRAVEETILALDSTVLAVSHRHYPGVTERYDYVLELVNGRVVQYAAADYFEAVAV
ncbi:MAG: hypothetical protein A2087_11045 [Spirochaetes bacterium GWD1_61_31]|nr:MAG: hypothetical protein A2Y37_10005 [Spirochaetes bacterium GWB1_60_80]OHD29085.1 MAG: hypothetical protein A2004_14645 [Spirochaetes bacterium GWC1_61_12]OHD43116.1 MAG: hypothetical protein A2087_11045 [Spirochaetes bacterium GWD1_61_31]OHD44250.1 MAG: hypothetical protein A2Y35_06840 [Spirochaetes bacterium GWE1_60_18]OHD60390.1 MAG: hypothetical protein A2Y32_00685 [Spirochaetes bacterium GWF1_60_12]HAP43294.1 hypothetical protein [Spirochaetaceae bacterium]